jgi:membrane associated rhomboid family serine protease
MENVGLSGLILLIIILLTSYSGFRHQDYFDRFLFRVDDILIGKEYRRLFTSAFLHVGWWHLIFNLVALSTFSEGLEYSIGTSKFLLIFFSSLLGGNLLALYIHRNHGDYSAVGASGAISGLLFASIALFPNIQLSILFLPISFPGWAFGLVYVLVTLYGIKAQRDTIGHEAHLGGGLVGMLVAIAFYPETLLSNALPIACIAVPSMIFLYFLVSNPAFLLIPFLQKKKQLTIEEHYNGKKVDEEKELNRLLEKIHQKGYESLNKKEKEFLKEFSSKEV